jgi:hypothetical protein
MYVLTDVFHLASLVLCATVLWVLAGYRKKWSFQRSLWQQFGAGRRKFVDSPLQFMALLSECLGIEWEKQSSVEVKVCAIDPRPWLELHVGYSVVKIAFQAKQEGEEPSGNFVVSLGAKLDDEAKWRDRLVSSLGQGFTVSFEV